MRETEGMLIADAGVLRRGYFGRLQSLLTTRARARRTAVSVPSRHLASSDRHIYASI